VRLVCAAGAAIALAGCNNDAPSAPSPGDNPVVTITATGVTPTEVRVSRFGRVTFVNNDTRAHEINSDPIDTHTDCPAVNGVGLLNPGQSGDTGTFSVSRVCGFHDHTRETDPAFKGRIVVE
jgi:plastocyanin